VSPQPAYQTPGPVRLKIDTFAYVSREDAHEADVALESVVIAPGEYLLGPAQRNERHAHDLANGDGYYYSIQTPEGTRWIRQNELLMGVEGWRE
jgi:hypothetical protein